MACSPLAVLIALAVITGVVWCDDLAGQRWDDMKGPWIQAQPRPPIPTWPDQFVTGFYMYIQRLGTGFKSKGSVYYDYTDKKLRGDFYDYCIPLFDTDKPTFNNFTCSYLSVDGNMYYVNHTSTIWTENKCCLFQKGLGVVPPDWMKGGQYNGTTEIYGFTADVWWFPGTDADDPCFAYWNKVDASKLPIQFWGVISNGSDGGAILDYYDFTPGKIPEDINMTKPNADCDVDCVVPTGPMRFGWPEWPTCP